VGRSASESGSNGPGRSFFFAFFSARTINLAAVYQRRRRTVPDSRGTSDGRWPRRVVHAAARGRTGGLPSCVTLSVLALSKIREEYVRCATCKLRGPREQQQQQQATAAGNGKEHGAWSMEVPGARAKGRDPDWILRRRGRGLSGLAPRVFLKRCKQYTRVECILSYVPLCRFEQL